MMKDKLWFFASYLPSLETLRAVDAVQQRHARRSRADRRHPVPLGQRHVAADQQHARQDRLQLGQAHHRGRAAGPRAAGRERHDGGDGAARHQRHPAELVAVGQLRLGRQRQVLHRRPRRLLQAGPVQRGHPVGDAVPLPARPTSAWPACRRSSSSNSGYTNIPTNRSVTRNIFGRGNFQVDGTYYGSFAGSHTLKGGVQFDRIANDVLDSEQSNLIRISWDRDARPATRPRHLRLLPGAQQRREPGSGLQRRGRHRQHQRRPVHPGLVGGERSPDAEPRPAHGERERPVLHDRGRHRADRHRVGLRREAGAAPGLRLRRRRRRQDEAVRQLGHLLRHLQAGAAAGLVRRPEVARVLLHARHAELRVARSRRLPAGVPGPAARRSDRLPSPVERDR